MADQAKKKCWGSSREHLNKLRTFLDDNSPPELVKPHYEKVQESSTVPEDAHDQYLGEIDEEDLQSRRSMYLIDRW